MTQLRPSLSSTPHHPYLSAHLRLVIVRVFLSLQTVHTSLRVLPSNFLFFSIDPAPKTPPHQCIFYSFLFSSSSWFPVPLCSLSASQVTILVVLQNAAAWKVMTASHSMQSRTASARLSLQQRFWALELPIRKSSNVSLLALSGEVGLALVTST